MVHRENYLQVKAFLDALTEAERLSPESVSRYWFCARHLLLWAGERPLSEAHLIRPPFTAYLGSEVRSGGHRQRKGPLTPATMLKTSQVCRRILTWLRSSYAREYQDLPATWIGTIQPPKHIVGVSRPCYVSLEEALKLGSVDVGDGDLALRRDRAASGLLFLSGMRASALCTLPISCLDLETRTVKQLPEMGVKTKNSKSATTYLLEIPKLLEVVRDWDDLVRGELPGTAAWYAPVISRWGEQILSAKAPGANRNQALAKRLRKLFVRAGLAYKSPHKFRHGFAVYGLLNARTMADYKAVSMNLMHNDISVTDGIYAVLGSDEVQKRISQLGTSGTKPGHKNDGKAPFLEDLDAKSIAEILVQIAGKLSE